MPSKETPKSEICTSVRVCLVEGRKLLGGLRNENMCYALISKKFYLESKELVEIKELLIEYEVIISNNVPDGLPHMRSIGHCMDLILGASLSNKATH